MLFHILEMIKSIIKNAVAYIFFYSGAFHFLRLLRNICGYRLTIITYHRVSRNHIEEIEQSLPFLFVTSRIFEAQLNFLKKYFRVINFSDLENVKNGRKLAWNSLIITFDDGYEDNYTEAFQIMRKHNIPWTIFIATDMIGKQEITWWDRLFAFFTTLIRVNHENNNIEMSSELLEVFKKFEKNASQFFLILNSWGQNRIERLIFELEKLIDMAEDVYLKNRFLDWNQVNAMANFGVEIGSHTCSHQILTTLEEDDMRREFLESKNTIENKINKRVTAVSYPAGKFSEKIKNITDEAGYKFAVTQIKGVNGLDDRYALKRINIWEKTALSKSGVFSKELFSWRLSGF